MDVNAGVSDFLSHLDRMQRLSGRSINPSLQMFGQSISGSVDMDGNGYPGLALDTWLVLLE